MPISTLSTQIWGSSLLANVVQFPGGLTADAVIAEARSGPGGGFLAQTVVRFDVGVAEESQIFRWMLFGMGLVLGAGQVVVFVILQKKKR